MALQAPGLPWGVGAEGIASVSQPGAQHRGGGALLQLGEALIM